MSPIQQQSRWLKGTCPTRPHPAPCPFCGSTASLNEQRGEKVHGYDLAMVVSVECNSIDCGATGPVLGCQSEQYHAIDALPAEAVRRWNERCETALQARVDALEGDKAMALHQARLHRYSYGQFPYDDIANALYPHKDTTEID